MADFSLFVLIITLPATLAGSNHHVLRTEFSYFQSCIPTESVTLWGDVYERSGTLFLMPTATNSAARVLYNNPVQLAFLPRNRDHSALGIVSFSTSFSFQIVGQSNGGSSIQPGSAESFGEGLAFILVPPDEQNLPPNSAGGYLGLLNSSMNGSDKNHILAVEFDTNKNMEFKDVSNNHIGIDVNGVISVAWVDLSVGNYNSFPSLLSNSNLTAWIDYNGTTQTIEVRLSNETASAKPTQAMLSYKYNISQQLGPSIYVGFSASSGSIRALKRIDSWNFSTMVSQISDPVTSPSSRVYFTQLVIGFGIGVPVIIAAVAGTIVMLLKHRKRLQNLHEFDGKSPSALELPMSFTYKELSVATRGFSRRQVLGRGGSCTVYKGFLSTDKKNAVAVKLLSEGIQQSRVSFMSEISIIGSLRHRNLVPLRGWCHEKGKMLLVYEYMPKGSLDTLLFGSYIEVLGWEQRFHILGGVAAALVYLHEGWEQQVLHRDVKAGNVLVDENFNARLGDFGLARLIRHSKLGQTMTAVGTLGYMAPEVAQTGRATEKSDVYGFGILCLEVGCGRAALKWNLPDEEEVLIDWVWQMQERRKLISVADRRLADDYDKNQMLCVLQVGLLCCHPSPERRPSMRQVEQIFNGELRIPSIPHSRPVARYDSKHFEAETVAPVLLEDHSLSFKPLALSYSMHIEPETVAPVVVESYAASQSEEKESKLSLPR